MAARKITVADIADKMGAGNDDIIKRLRRLGADVSTGSDVLEPEVIQALLTGRELPVGARRPMAKSNNAAPHGRDQLGVEEVGASRPMQAPLADAVDVRSALLWIANELRAMNVNLEEISRKLDDTPSSTDSIDIVSAIDGLASELRGSYGEDLTDVCNLLREIRDNTS